MQTEEKKIELEKIAGEIRAFKGLEIARNATQAVPGEGNPDAAMMFVGEAPGFNEDLQGRPFVGQAGKLLDKTLAGIGIDRQDVYITNIVKFRPPDNRDPFPDEIEACRDWLDRQIAIIDPKIIVTLGRFSMAKFMPDVSISGVHGLPRMFGKYIIMPMYHPAAALRGGTVMNLFVQDFNKLKSLLNPQKPIEPVKIEPAQKTLF